MRNFDGNIVAAIVKKIVVVKVHMILVKVVEDDTVDMMFVIDKLVVVVVADKAFVVDYNIATVVVALILYFEHMLLATYNFVDH